MNTIIHKVPTNIMTGFLGTGKSSSIQHLLRFKPKHERWAVLVNEFGAVGIDATMYQNKFAEEGGVFVREVPGGCMCCASGLPMQIALNVLLKLSNPHRLLIEPSGLGHPIEVVSLLLSKYYKNVLDIQKILTVIDPKHFLKAPYFKHPTFQQQLTVADTWVFNKMDTISNKQWDAINKKIEINDWGAVNRIHVKHGRIKPEVLSGKTQFKVTNKVQVRQTDSVEANQLPAQPIIPEDSGCIKESRFDEGFHGTSWRYKKNRVFNKLHLFEWIKGIKALRIKGVFMTNEGVWGVNVMNSEIEYIRFKDCSESKLEIISENVSLGWDQELAGCLVTTL